MPRLIPLLLIILALPLHAERRVVFTFDDIPGAQVSNGNCNVGELTQLNRDLVKAITRNRIPALGLVVDSRICPGQRAKLAGLYEIWLAAGLELGNHTASHRDFNRIPLEEFQRDTVAGEATLATLLAKRNRRIRFFRYPFLRSGTELDKKRAFETFLTARGYTNAPVTIDNDEYIYAAVYARAKRDKDAALAKKIADDYLRYMESIFAFYETLSRDTLGYELPHILLLHDNRLNADTLDRLVQMTKRRGYRSITMDEALRDPAYAKRDGYIGRRGLSWLHRWALDDGKKPPAQPGAAEWIAKLYEQR